MVDSEGWGYELTILFATAFRSAVDELHQQLSTLGFDDVRPSHGFVFQRLAAKGATGVELAEHMSITKQAATLMVDYLEEHDYVKRIAHPTDRRGKLVVLTDRGWDCIRATESIFTSIENRWRDILGEDKMVSLRADLQKLVYATGTAESLRFRPVW